MKIIGEDTPTDKLLESCELLTKSTITIQREMAELEKTALKVKRDRDALLEAAKMIMNAPGIEIEYGGPSWDALEAAIKQAERP